MCVHLVKQQDVCNLLSNYSEKKLNTHLYTHIHIYI